MKLITIGRGKGCDVRLSEGNETVSLKQAVIKVGFTGKMEIYDVGENGTYVNGKKVHKPQGVPVKRGDNVNFAHIEDLDWSKVKDPYKKTRIFLLSAALLIAVGLIAGVILYMRNSHSPSVKKVEQNCVMKMDTTAKKDSTSLDGKIRGNGANARAGKGRHTVNKKKKNSASIEDMRIKEEREAREALKKAELEEAYRKYRR
ncbi:MAG: FHA domain-containing protein [Candidatus Amulumruptor caecigallinarius]|nr:FHA domain-containing protein [Candidatus Amulumruptor caecigallinarius]